MAKFFFQRIIPLNQGQLEKNITICQGNILMPAKAFSSIMKSYFIYAIKIQKGMLYCDEQSRSQVGIVSCAED